MIEAITFDQFFVAIGRGYGPDRMGEVGGYGVRSGPLPSGKFSSYPNSVHTSHQISSPDVYYIRCLFLRLSQMSWNKRAPLRGHKHRDQTEQSLKNDS